MRLSKTVDNVKYTYLYEGGLLVQEIRDNRILDYSYDANGRPRMVKYRILNQNYEKCFYYALNSRNDVIGLYDKNGSLIAKYNYDVWGNKLSVTNQNDVTITSDTHIANFQSLRYRSYYYDTDSGFYYLQSRYYDPVTHRFINADGLVSTSTGVLGYNMFACCNNNPVNCSDPSGRKWVKAVIAVVVVVAVILVGKAIADNKINKSDANDAEKKLAKKHYFAAYKVNQARNIAEEYVYNTYGRKNDRDNTQVNAYRHAMWNAVMTDKIGEEKAKKFADAHEQFVGNPIEQKEMDLFNNELGRKIALEHEGESYDVFSQKIQEAINNGEAMVIEWDPNVNWL